MNNKFVPTPIAGYPAAIIGTSNENASTTCRLALGVKDDLLAIITYSGNPNNMTTGQDCTNATKLAGDIVDNVKSKSS